MGWPGMVVGEPTGKDVGYEAGSAAAPPHRRMRSGFWFGPMPASEERL